MLHLIPTQFFFADQTMEKLGGNGGKKWKKIASTRLDPNQTFRRLFVIGGEKFLSCCTAAIEPRAKFQGERERPGLKCFDSFETEIGWNTL